MALPLVAFAASDAGKKAISSVLGSLGGLVGGLFKGHSDWYYVRQHMYGWSINVSGSKSNEFGSDVFDMYRKDIKNAIALSAQGQPSDLDDANGIMRYHVVKAALSVNTQYFKISQDDDLIKIACELVNVGALPTDNMVVRPPDFGDKYNHSWVKYQIDNVGAIEELKKTQYWQDNFLPKSVLSSSSSAVKAVLNNTLVEPVKDANGNTVVDANGVIQYKTKTSVWVILCIVAVCIVVLGFVVRLFRKKPKRK